MTATPARAQRHGRHHRRTLGCLCAVLFAVLCAVTNAHAQPAPDTRWNSWLGCWALVADGRELLPPGAGVSDRGRLDEGAGAPPDTGAARARASRGSVARANADRTAQVCVSHQDGGAELRTRVADETVLTQTIVADGVDHAITDGDCRGTQRAEWSADGFRLFSEARLTCDNQTPRTVTGLALIGQDGHWIDVQAVTVDGRDTVRVRRFRPAASDAGRGTLPAAAVRLSIDDVKEASAHLAPQALEAALIETRSRFGLSSKVLLDLDRAGVPDSVTDLMVALSYPESFAIRPSAPVDRLTPFPPYVDAFDIGLDYPWQFGPYGGYGNYYYSPYFFSPFGYSGLRLYPQYFGTSGLLTPVGGSGRLPDGLPPESGRAVNGRGYTRVYPRGQDAAGDATATTRSGASSRGAVSPRGYTAGSDAGGGSSSGSSGGASTGGASSGSSGDGGGRTAVPR